jgi:hypothetical protein
MLGITEECSGSRRNARDHGGMLGITEECRRSVRMHACSTHALVEGTLQGPSARRAINLAAM